MVGSLGRTARQFGVGIAFFATGLFFVVLCVETYAEQSMRLHTRTISARQFLTNGPPYFTSLATFRAFEARHRFNLEERDGLRFSIEEWPDWKYLISIQSQPGGAARVIIAATPYGADRPSYEREVLLDKQEALLFLKSFDQQTDGFRGSMGGCLDGTSFQFERWRNGKVSGAYGNAACQRHYAELMSLVAETLALRLPNVPFDWRTWLTAKRYLELSEHAG